MGSLRGTAWGSRSFFHQLSLLWFLQIEVVGTHLLALEPWARGPGVGLGLLAPEISLPNFYPPHMGEGPTHSVFVPLLVVWVDVISLILWSSDFPSTRFLTVLSDGCSIFWL